MLNSVATYLKEGTLYTSIELRECNGLEKWYLVVVKRKKKELKILKAMVSDDVKKLHKAIPEHRPLILILNTTQTLHKEVIITGEQQTLATVNNAYPNLDENLFLYQLLPLEGSCWVAIAKKDYVERMVNQLHLLKIFPTHFSLGVMGVQSILPYITTPPVVLPDIHFQLENKKIISGIPDREDHTDDLTINGLALDRNSIFGFAAILGRITNETSISNFNLWTLKWQKEQYHARIFSLGLRLIIPLLLGLLMLNFMVFNFYFGKTQDIKATLTTDVVNRVNLETLKQTVMKMEERLASISIANHSKSTYYLDEIAQHLPKELLLSEIIYQPLERTIEKGKAIQIQENQIIIYGESSNSDIFSRWIAALEQIAWVSSVTTMEYNFISSQQSGFSIKISLHE